MTILMTAINNTEYKLTVKRFIPGIAWFFVVMLLLFTPGPDLPEVGDWFSRISFDKVIHIGVFALLAFLFMMPVGKSRWARTDKAHYFLKIALATCLWGITSELVQKYFIPGRSFDLLDWTVDTIGGFVAWAFSRRRYLK